MSTPQNKLRVLSGIDFFQLAKQEPNPRIRIRLLALGNLQAGKTKKEVIGIFNISFPTLRKWVTRFAAEGIDGLKEKPGKGRKRKLSLEHEEEFRKEVELLQEQKEGGRIRGQDIQVLLKEKFCVDHALPSVYHVLKRCGMSWISSRSKHPKTSLEIQEDFKKKSRKK